MSINASYRAGARKRPTACPSRDRAIALQLIPRISTIGELNEYEALNILSAREWAFDSCESACAAPSNRHHGRGFDGENVVLIAPILLSSCISVTNPERRHFSFAPVVSK